MPRMVCGPKKNKKKRRNVPKKRRNVPKKHIQLENDVLADPLGVRGSNFVQKKGINAENGLRPKEKKKKSRNVPKKRRDVPKKRRNVPKKTHSTGK